MSALRSLLRRAARPLRRAAGKLLPPKEASGPQIESARTIAFVVNNASDARGQAWLEAAKARGAEIDMLPLFKPYRREDERVMSFLLPPPRRAYDGIVVGKAVALFEHSWSYAFLDRLNGYLNETGTLFIPRQANKTRLLSDARLSALFGSAPRHADKRFLAFGKKQGGLARPDGAATSILDAYFANRDALIQGRFDPKLADTIRALGVRRVLPMSAYRADAYLSQLQSQSYRTSSASMKSAVTQHIAARYFPGRDDLRLVDLGAGTGLNALELLLDRSGIAHVMLVEPNASYHWPIALMVEALGARVAGRVSLSPRRVEDYQGDPVDIAVVCAVLSGVAAEGRAAFVERAWNNLAPGGILAVQENMLGVGSSEGAAMNKTRCTPEEIDALLGRFGKIRYFAHDALKEFARADVEDRTVVRVIQRPK